MELWVHIFLDIAQYVAKKFFLRKNIDISEFWIQTSSAYSASQRWLTVTPSCTGTKKKMENAMAEELKGKVADRKSVV